MTLELRLLGPEAPVRVSAPIDADIDAALAAMPPRARLVLDRPDEVDRAEHYLQVERSPADADYWHIEVRLGTADQHMITSTRDPEQAATIIRNWRRNENTLPPATRWWQYCHGNAFADRLYDLTAYIASADVEPLWRRERWQVFAPVLAPLLQTGRGRASVRSLQLEPTAGTGRARPVTFGTLAWGVRSEQKWTHERLDSRRFLHTEVFVPSWPTSYREGIAPDVVFRVTGSPDSSQRFNVLVATATDMPHPHRPHLHDVLRSLLRPSLIAIKQRPFGVGTGRSYRQPLTDYDPIGSVRATTVAELREDEPLRTGPPTETWKLAV